MRNAVAPLRSKEEKWRPYGIAGVGVIHPWIEGQGDQYPIAQNNLAVDAGGGIIYALNDHVELRGDLRYFRAFVDESKQRRARTAVKIGVPPPRPIGTLHREEPIGPDRPSARTGS
jgi:hypothetical protein